MSDVYDPVTAAQPGFKPHRCAHCGWHYAAYAIRVNEQGRDWTVWPNIVIPTGARIDTYLCGPCIIQAVDETDILFNSMRLVSHPVLGKRSAMRRILSELRMRGGSKR